MSGSHRRLQFLGLLGVIAAAVLVCTMLPGPGSQSPKLQPPPPPPKSTASANPGHGMGNKLPFELKNGKATLGNPDAKVKTTVYIPAQEGCGNETALFMYRLSKANPTKLSVTVMDFKGSEGAASQQKEGVSCAGILINGKQQVTVKSPTGQPRTINFHSNMGDTYKETDVYLALDQAFGQAYGTTCKRAAAEKKQTSHGARPAPTTDTAPAGTKPR